MVVFKEFKIRNRSFNGYYVVFIKGIFFNISKARKLLLMIQVYLIMKKNIIYTIIIGIVSTLLVSFKSFTDTEKMPVDLTKSKIEWVAGKIGGKHNGFITLTSATLSIEGNYLKGGEFIVDTKSMTDADLTFKKANRWLMGHLKNNFFEVDKYPTASFVITSVTPVGDKFDVIGKMTIKDITQEIKFPAIITTSATSVTATAAIIIDRLKFNVNYGSGFVKELADKAIKHETRRK